MKLTRIFHSPPRSIIAITKPINAAVNVYLCEHCGHAQSDDIDYKKFYDRDYRFQLLSSDYDELHAIVDKKRIYRTDLQAQIAAELLDVPSGAKVLDYGAAKGATLRKVLSQRTDLVPYVFDVSDAYTPLWNEWITKERQAEYSIPPSWIGTFNAILNFFVLEHVANPNEVVGQISELLRPGGLCIFAVPNPLDNYSDFAVLEHVSHFTQSSLAALLRQNGLEIEYYSSERFFGAHVVRVRKRPVDISSNLNCKIRAETARLKAVADFWAGAQIRLRDAAQANAGNPCAIYGASVYGSYIATRLEGCANLRCFVDRNPHMWGKSEFGIPIVGPDQLPADVRLIYAGVNPLKARDILADVPEWRGRSIETIFLSKP